MRPPHISISSEVSLPQPLTPMIPGSGSAVSLCQSVRTSRESQGTKGGLGDDSKPPTGESRGALGGAGDGMGRTASARGTWQASAITTGGGSREGGRRTATLTGSTAEVKGIEDGEGYLRGDGDGFKAEAGSEVLTIG